MDDDWDVFDDDADAVLLILSVLCFCCRLTVMFFLTKETLVVLKINCVISTCSDNVLLTT